jgi:hypothetical protein
MILVLFWEDESLGDESGGLFLLKYECGCGCGHWL